MLDWQVQGSVAGAPRARQSRADHGRGQARRGHDLPSLACGGCQPDAALSRLRRRGAAPSSRAQSPAQRLGRAITAEDWENLIGADLRAPLFIAQAAAPALKKSQGAIVNITDIHAERPLKNYVLYSIAKAGLVGLTRSLARELAPEIRVNAVAPGPILWPDDADAFDELSRQRIISHTPLKREGTPDDIAKAVLFLLVEATYVTGETINVDGGRHVVL